MDSCIDQLDAGQDDFVPKFEARLCFDDVSGFNAQLQLIDDLLNPQQSVEVKPEEEDWTEFYEFCQAAGGVENELLEIKPEPPTDSQPIAARPLEDEPEIVCASLDVEDLQSHFLLEINTKSSIKKADPEKAASPNTSLVKVNSDSFSYYEMVNNTNGQLCETNSSGTVEETQMPDLYSAMDSFLDDMVYEENSNDAIITSDPGAFEEAYLAYQHNVIEGEATSFEPDADVPTSSFQNVVDDVIEQWPLGEGSQLVTPIQNGEINQLQPDQQQFQVLGDADINSLLHKDSSFDTIEPIDVASYSDAPDFFLQDSKDDVDWNHLLTDEQHQALVRELGAEEIVTTSFCTSTPKLTKSKEKKNTAKPAELPLLGTPLAAVKTKISFVKRTPKAKPPSRASKIKSLTQTKKAENGPKLPKKKQKIAEPTIAIDPLEAVVSEVAMSTLDENFNPDEEQKKLKEFLEGPAEVLLTPEVSVISLTPPAPRIYKYYHLPRGLNVPLKCANCLQVFTKDQFSEHICDYNSNHEPLSDAVIEKAETTYENETEHGFPMSTPLQQESLASQATTKAELPASRILRENQARIHRFFKEELRFDLKNLYDEADIDDYDSVKSFNTDTNSVFSKKFLGQHECSLCDRKFVHASGLIRHIEKHNLDLIPQAHSNYSDIKESPADNPRDIRVAVKCRFCGCTHFKIGAALDHVINFHLSREFDVSDDAPEDDNFFEADNEILVSQKLLEMKTAQNERRSRESQEASQNESSELCSDQDSKDRHKVYLKLICLGCALQCEFCDYLFTSISDLFEHSNRHEPKYPFQCKSCDIFVTTSKEIFTHLQTECVFLREGLKEIQINLPRLYVCNLCGNKFQTMDKLLEHRYNQYHFYPRLNKEAKKLQIPCEYCRLTFNKASALVCHYNVAHRGKIKRPTCTETVPVPLSSSKAGGGAGSSRATNGPRSRLFLCEICGKSYTQSSHLWQHLRFHQGVKPFVCSENNCGRQFTIRPDLQDHIRKCHTGERPFHCLICGKRFLTGSVFYQHRLIHRGERRYECEQCGKRFYRADALKNHNRIHTGEKPFGCDYCTKYFRQRGDRDKHVRARHSHLDENTRQMMQLQKKRLEEAERQKELEQKQRDIMQPLHDSFVYGNDESVNGNAIDTEQMVTEAEALLPFDECSEVNETGGTTIVEDATMMDDSAVDASENVQELNDVTIEIPNIELFSDEAVSEELFLSDLDTENTQNDDANDSSGSLSNENDDDCSSEEVDAMEEEWLVDSYDESS